MHEACPAHMRELCKPSGCHRLNSMAIRPEGRCAYGELSKLPAVVQTWGHGGMATGWSAARPPIEVGSVQHADLDLQVKRLDVESGDILVVRTAKKLTAAQADAIDAQVSQLARRHGVRDVSVMVLDNATDLTVERPGAVDTRMQHQAPRAAPIVSR